MAKRPVIGALCICRETACGEFPALEMITQTIAAHAFSGTRLIAAIAVLHVFFLFAFHQNYSIRLFGI
jgi:hypothetical protein